jgi:uroporphyrinogen decarboxylase
LSPETLLIGGDNLNKEAENILLAFKNKPHIFNLGHGVLPKTPIDNVKQLVNKIRGNL